MRFSNVRLESIATVLPEETVSSAQIEERLRPLYERLRLPFGRLELMTGIRERRLWPRGTLPSSASALAGKAALARSQVKPEQIDLFIHAAVSRDMLEPASASFAHRAIGLPPSVQLFDLSNACLGFLNAITVAAGLIESGQIRSALIAAGENGRPLLDETVRTLLSEPLDRNAIKPYFANLTIGSGAVAAVVCREDLASARSHRLVGGVCRAATEASDLCRGDATAGGLAMQTDSERLLEAGVALAADTWRAFEAEIGWEKGGIHKFICHQVGSAHRRRMYETLNLDATKDFSTFETLGNMGSVSLPATLSAAADAGAIRHGDRVALLGIGSGLNCLMMGVEW